jgi:hypothetical protein
LRTACKVFGQNVTEKFDPSSGCRPKVMIFQAIFVHRLALSVAHVLC